LFEAPVKIGHRVKAVRWTRPAGTRTQDRVLRGSRGSVLRDVESQQRSEASYRLGFEDGKKIGTQEGKEEIQPTLVLFKSMVADISQQKERIVKDAEETVLRLALMISQAIVHREVRIDESIIRNVVKESLKLVDDRKRITIKVHPDDWKSVTQNEKDVAAAIHGVKELELKEDDRIRPGGCVIESDSGIVDARLETRFDEVKRRLMEVL